MENQNNLPPAGARSLPPRRVTPVDGFAGRPISRPNSARINDFRPSARPVAIPLPPTAAQSTTTTATDNLGLPLAGPTPLTELTSTKQPLTFVPPIQPEIAEPAPVRKQRIRPLLIAGRKFGRALLRRRVLVPAAILVGLLMVGGGVFAAVQYIRTQASPDTVYREALTNALMTKHVQIDQQSLTGNSKILLDMTNVKNPKISNTATVSLAGANFAITTYGTKSDSFMAYSTLPNGLPASTIAAVSNHWVKLRQSSRLPAGINAALRNAADPRYETFGPLVFANLDSKTSAKIARFLVDHKVYGYSLSKVQKVSLGSKKALLFSGAFDADYSKLANQSVATSEAFDMSDVQHIGDGFAKYKGGTSALYVDPGKRLPLRLVLTTATGETVSYDYDTSDAGQLPPVPTANIDWPQFATTQLQIEAQASALLTPAQRDTLSQTSLLAIQTAITQYYNKNGFYPSLANLNNQTWLATNLPSFDPDTTRDPRSSSLALLSALPTPPPATKTNVKAPVVTTPIYGFVYQPVSVAAKACANEATTPAEQHCTSYTLSAVMSNGQLYSLKNSQ